MFPVFNRDKRKARIFLVTQLGNFVRPQNESRNESCTILSKLKLHIKEPFTISLDLESENESGFLWLFGLKSFELTAKTS